MQQIGPCLKEGIRLSVGHTMNLKMNYGFCRLLQKRPANQRAVFSASKVAVVSTTRSCDYVMRARKRLCGTVLEDG